MHKKAPQPVFVLRTTLLFCCLVLPRVTLRTVEKVISQSGYIPFSDLYMAAMFVSKRCFCFTLSHFSSFKARET